MKSAKSAADPIQEKFLATRREMANALIERDQEIDLALTALIAQEHLLLVGPPGAGKSLLLDALMNWTSGKRFAILLNKFTVPEEVAGPISVQALKEDHYRRVTPAPGKEERGCRDRWPAGPHSVGLCLPLAGRRAGAGRAGLRLQGVGRVGPRHDRKVGKHVALQARPWTLYLPIKTYGRFPTEAIPKLKGNVARWQIDPQAACVRPCSS